MSLEGVILVLLSFSFVGTCFMFWMWYQFTKTQDMTSQEEAYYLEMEDEDLDV
ncbi:MAG: hypothetical protein LRY73_01795 [Bacillus sp. (in: Bacteria)]|nr:hypothetical protein [Bacillus sp. (in: firmicutes)]